MEIFVEYFDGRRIIKAIRVDVYETISSVLNRFLDDYHGGGITNRKNHFVRNGYDPYKDYCFYLSTGSGIPIRNETTLAWNNIQKNATVYCRTRRTFRYGCCFGCLAESLSYLNVNSSKAHDHTSEAIYDTTEIDHYRTIISIFFNRNKSTEMRTIVTKMMNLMSVVEQKEENQSFSRQKIGMNALFLSELGSTIHFIRNEYRFSKKTPVHATEESIQLHNLRCPICFSRFESTPSNSPRLAVHLCRESTLHPICSACASQVHRSCPFCRSNQLNTPPIPAQEIIDQLVSLTTRLKEICAVREEVQSAIDITGKQPIAIGGYAHVYKIEVNKDLIVAVKVPHSTTSINRESYERELLHEVAMALPISHMPYFVSMYGYAQIPNSEDYGIVMEFVDHPTLAKALSEGTIAMLPVERRIQICMDLCRGVGEMHVAGIIHKDLKPENILYCGFAFESRSERPENSSRFQRRRKAINSSQYISKSSVKITDFGVSSLMETMTGTCGRLHGTIGYEAPEICQSETSNLLPARSSDIYSLSLILFEILEGRRIFTNLSPAQILTQYVIQGKRPQWSAQQIPKMIKEVIECGWHVDPDQRPDIHKFLDILYHWCVKKSLGDNFQEIDRISSSDVPSFVYQLLEDSENYFPMFPDYVDYLHGNVLDWKPEEAIYWKMISAIVLRLQAGDIEFVEALHDFLDKSKDTFEHYESRANNGELIY